MSRQEKLCAELASIAAELTTTEALRTRRRQLFRILYEKYGMSYGQIGQVAGVSLHAVAKDLSRNSV